MSEIETTHLWTYFHRGLHERSCCDNRIAFLLMTEWTDAGAAYQSEWDGQIPPAVIVSGSKVSVVDMGWKVFTLGRTARACSEEVTTRVGSVRLERTRSVCNNTSENGRMVCNVSAARTKLTLRVGRKMEHNSENNIGRMRLTAIWLHSTSSFLVNIQA